RDFSALPILADALQDADYPDGGVLKQLREPLEEWQAQRLVALLYSEESAAAIRWLEQFVRDINYGAYAQEKNEYIRKYDDDPHTYAGIIEQGYNGKEGGDMYFGSDAGADYFRAGEDNVREFYRNWALATGEAMPEDLGDIGFSCAC